MKNRMSGNGKALSLRSLSVAALAGLAFMGASWNQSAAANTQTQISPMEREKFVSEQVKLTNLREGVLTGAAADLTPTIDALHAADPENNPQESVFEYVDSEDDANTNIEINYKDYDAETGEITGDVTKYINLKQTEYGLNPQPTLDMLNAQDAETYPRGSAYTFKDTAEDSNTGMSVVTQYIVDKTNPDTIFTAGQPKYLDINKTTYANGDITYSWDAANNKMNVTLSGNSVKTYNDGIYEYIGNVTSKNSTAASGNINGSNFYYSNADVISNSLTLTVTNDKALAKTYGGAIYNPNITSLTADFIGNTVSSITKGSSTTTQQNRMAYAYGGAIYGGTINTLKGDFIGNLVSARSEHYGYGSNQKYSYAYGYGGAISDAKITNLIGDFIGNSVYSYAVGTQTSSIGYSNAYVYGGAIANSTITNLTGNFINNSIRRTSGQGETLGSAIYNSTIENLNGNFIANSKGGVIAKSTITNLTGDFIDNLGIGLLGTNVTNLNGNFINNAGSAINNSEIENLTGNFIGNTNYDGSGGSGGAIYSTKITNLIGDFISNKANGYGGAIYISYDGAIADITGDFIDNSAQNGGAIYGYSANKMTSLKGNFIGNSAGQYGGALNKTKIETLTGDFIDNSAGNGGAIYDSEITNLNSNFISNTANHYGGAISSGTINNLEGDFINNSAVYGGAIYDATILNLNSRFENNSVTSTDGEAAGGAISNAKISHLIGDFVNNAAYAPNGDAKGGAIHNSGWNAVIGDIEGDFLGNHAEGSHADGGAIYNHGGSARIGNITGDFIGNYAISLGGVQEHEGDSYYTEPSYPGISAYTNEGPILSCGGAIYNVGATIGNITGDFKDNYYQTETVQANGGGIFNVSTQFNTAKIGDIQSVFDNNRAISISGDANGGAIYNSGIIGNIPTGISAQYHKYIITDNDGNELRTLYDAATYAGDNNYNAQFDSLTAEQVRSGDYEFKLGETITMTLDEFNTYYSDNGFDEGFVVESVGHGGGMSLMEFSPEDDENGDTETNPSDQTIDDIIARAEALGVHLIEDNPAEYNFVSPDNPIYGIINSSFVNNYAKTEKGIAHGGAVYTTSDLQLASTNGHEFLIDGNYVEDKDGTRPEAIYLDIQSGFQEGVRGNGGNVLLDAENWNTIWYDSFYQDFLVGGEAPTLTINAQSEGTFVINDQIVGAPAQELETITYSKLKYTGIGDVVKYADVYDYRTGEYVNPDSLDTLLEDTQEWTWFAAVYNETTDEWKPSVIYYKDGTNEVTFYNEATSEWIVAEARYDGETGDYLGLYNKETDELITNVAEPNFNKNTIDYLVYGDDDPVLSVEGTVTTQKQYVRYDNNYGYYVPVDDPEMETVTIGGKAKLVIKGDETGKVFVNNNIKNLDITHNDVTTTVSDYMFLNQTDDGSINSLTMNSGTLNLGVMGLTPLHFENFSMNGGTINIDAIDVDLANKIMGRITADNYTDALGGAINVRALNLLSDSEDTLTVVAFADEAFKNTVVSHVTEAFTPIYRYEVEYDTNKQYGQETEEGYFVFKRPGNEDTTPGGDDTIPGGDDTIPGGDDTIPGGDDTIPGGDDTVPGGDDTVPGGDDTVPGGDDTVPGGDDTVPGGDDTVPGGDDTVPGGDDTVPGGDDTVPGGDDTIPGGDDTIPGGDDTIPGGDDTIPGGDDTIPGGDDTVPGGDDTVPGGDDTIPGGDDTVPGGDDTVPGGDDTVPGGDDTVPGGDDTVPGGDDTIPGGDDTVPGGDDTVPGGDDTVPGGDDTVPGGDDTIPGGDDTVPGGDDTVPGGDDTVPGGDDTVPGGDDTVPGGDDTVPGGDDTVPGGDDTVPGGDDTIPGGDDEPDPIDPRINGGGSSGHGGNPSKRFNPAVLASPVATQAAGQATINQTFQYVFEHADAFTQLPAIDRFAKIHNNEYAMSTDYNSNLGSIDVDHQNKAVWVRPYTSFDKTELKNGPEVKSINYGTIIGGDSEFRKLSHGWANVGTAYAGYFGSQVDHKNVSTTMNGGLVGLTETFYKGNFFTALTASVGAGMAESHTMYGKDDITMLMAGVASKSGYNFEFKEGKFIVQPLLMMNYTMVNTFDYTNAAGVKIDSDPLHTIQLNPSVRFIGNLKGGWQPYASVGMVWNLMNETDVRANGIELPHMHTKPYVEYGVGLQRHWNEKFSAFGQAMVRNGGRTGVALTAGFRWTLGSDKPKEENDKNVKLDGSKQVTVIKGERSRSTGAAVSTEQSNNVIKPVLNGERVLVNTKALTKEEIAARAANLAKYNSLIK